LCALKNDVVCVCVRACACVRVRVRVRVCVESLSCVQATPIKPTDY